MKTGKEHWELLTRARAIEHQCYVLAANQTGVHSPGKESYGHSMVIDPWGTKLADTGEPPGIALASIDSERIDAVRRQLPALANRRADLERAGS
jgi:predicted amidohydrolase